MRLKNTFVNRSTPNDPYMGRTAPLTSKRCILYIYSTNIGTEYFKHALYPPFFFPLKNAVCFIMLTCLVPVLFTFYIQGVLKLKKNNSGAKGLIRYSKCNIKQTSPGGRGVFVEEASRKIQREMKLGTWNVRSIYRAGSLKAAARELARYKLDVVGVQEVRWDKGGTVRAGDYNFFYGKGNENHQLGKGFLVHRRMVSAVKRVEFVSDRLSYMHQVRISRRWDVGMWTGLGWPRIRTGGGRL